MFFELLHERNCYMYFKVLASAAEQAKIFYIHFNSIGKTRGDTYRYDIMRLFRPIKRLLSADGSSVGVSTSFCPKPGVTADGTFGTALCPIADTA